MEATAEEVPRPLPSRPRAERLRDWIEWFGVGRLATIALSVLAVGAGGFWLLRPPPDPVESSLPRAGDPPAASVSDGGAGAPEVSGVPATTGTTVPTEVVVHVAGAVQMPGVHRLPAGARVVDAVAAAGGAAPHALLDALNLAQPLHDGDRVMVPAVGDTGPVAGGVTSAVPATASSPGSSGSAALLDLNAATAEQLESLPGVGPATAQAIVAHRDANGPFSSVDGLADVRGIGPAKLEAIRPLVAV